MSRFIYIDGVDKAAAVRFPDGYEVTSSAETGTVNLGRVEIDDPTGTIDIVPLKAAYIVETAAPAGNQRIWTGYLFNLTIDRGPYRNGPGRVWRADCVDVNFDLSRRIVLAASGKRPAETDLARLDWLLNGNLATVGIVFQGSLTNLTDNARNLDEADYRYATPMELLADVAPQCGKRAFAFYNESTAKVELFYDLADAAVNTSSSKISNVLSDAGSGVYAPYIDASLDRRGEEIASKWVLRWVGGVETQTRTDTQATYGEHVFTSESSRIGRRATAVSHTARLLANHEAPQDTVTCTLLLPQANVNDIKEGQRLQVKFSHLPDLTAYTYRRVISRILRMDPSDQYLVQLVIDNHVQAALGGGPGVGDFPNPPAADASVVQWKHADLPSGGSLNITLDAAPAEGNYLWLGASRRGGVPALDGSFTASPDGTFGPTGFYTDGGASGYRIVGAGESAAVQVRSSNGTEQSMTLVELAGVSAPDASSEQVSSSSGAFGIPSGFTAGTLTPPAGETGIVMMLGAVGCSDFASNGPTSVTPSAGWTELVDEADGNGAGFHPLHWVGHRAIQSASGSYSTSQGLVGGPYNYGGDGGQTLFFPSASGTLPPRPAQPFGPILPIETPNGTRVTFTLPAGYEWAPGSLRVDVDKFDQTASLLSSDPVARTFTFISAPHTGMLIEVYGQGI